MKTIKTQRSVIASGLLLMMLLSPLTALTQNGASSGGEVLTNDNVLALVKAGLHPSIIVNKIRASKTNFNTNTDELIRLQQAHVPADVINAMVEASSSSSIKSLATQSRQLNGTASSPDPPTGYPKEMGVYLKKDDQWSEVLPEVVNWKTAGVLKNIASIGIVKRDVNGHIEGNQSRLRIGSQIQFLIIAPEGVAITEYQLLRLKQHKDNREFRTITGNVFHAEGGATRDVVPFEGKKIASRTFLVTLNGLTVGEYGFLPPGGFTSASAASTLGKTYTFGVTAPQ